MAGVPGGARATSVIRKRLGHAAILLAKTETLTLAEIRNARINLYRVEYP